MLVGDGLLRVFWPNDLPRSSSPGVIVGWRNSDHDLFVITVLEHVEVRIVYNKARIELMESGQKCRKCAANRYFISQLPTPHGSAVLAMRKVCNACPRVDQPARIAQRIQCVPFVGNHEYVAEGSAHLLSARGKHFHTNHHVQSPSSKTHAVHVLRADFARSR